MLLVVLLYVGRRPQPQFALHFIIFLQEANVAAVQTATKKPWKETGRNQKKKVLSGDFHIFSAIFKTKKPMPITYNLCILSPCWMAHFLRIFTEDSCRKPAGSVPAQRSALWKNDRNVWKSCGKSRRKLAPQNSPGLHDGSRKLNMSLGWRIRWGRFFNSWLRLFHLEKVFRSVWQSAELQWYNAIKIQVQPFLLSLSKAYAYRYTV